MREISWIRAYAGSAVVHLLVVGAAAMFLAGAVMQQEQQQMYVIDLDTSELSSAGSGHADGGELFPEKLSETAVAERVAQIDASQSAVMPHPQLNRLPAVSPLRLPPVRLLLAEVVSAAVWELAAVRVLAQASETGRAMARAMEKAPATVRAAVTAAQKGPVHRRLIPMDSGLLSTPINPIRLWLSAAV